MKKSVKNLAIICTNSILFWTITTTGMNYKVTSDEIRSNPRFNREEFEYEFSSGGFKFKPQNLGFVDKKVIEIFDVKEEDYLDTMENAGDILFGLGKYGRHGRNLAYWMYNK